MLDLCRTRARCCRCGFNCAIFATFECLRAVLEGITRKFRGRRALNEVKRESERVYCPTPIKWPSYAGTWREGRQRFPPKVRLRNPTRINPPITPAGVPKKPPLGNRERLRGDKFANRLRLAHEIAYDIVTTTTARRRVLRARSSFRIKLLNTRVCWRPGAGTCC